MLKELNPNYTFKSFVSSDSNELAFAMAQGIAQNSGKQYNPFFLSGKYGTGKTHLLHAIGNEILENSEDSKIIYLTGKQFLHDILKNLQNERKKLYQECDVLMIDGIDTALDKEATQKGYLEIVDDLCSRGKQVIITSELPLEHFTYIYDHVISKYSEGAIVDIGYAENVRNEENMFIFPVVEKNTSAHPDFISFMCDQRKKEGERALHCEIKKFSEDFVESIKNNTVDEFKNSYRGYDQIIISGLESLNDKPRTQEELRLLVDSYTDRCRIVMFLLSKQPSDFENFDPLLMRRINTSMILEFGEPVAN